MKKLISIMCLTILVLSHVACTGTPVMNTASPEQQRANSREAQTELLTDTKR